MPDLYNTPILVSFHVAGALTTGLVAVRKVIPFDAAFVGASATLNTAPTGADVVVDVMHGATGIAAAALTTCWAVNNGTSGTTDLRPRVKATFFDQAPIVAGTTTVTPQGTDPPLSGQAAGVSTTTTNYDESPFLARPDPTTSAVFSGNQPDNMGQNPVILTGTSGSTLNTESGGANQLSAPLNAGYLLTAGDVLAIKIIQVGSTIAGSDLELQLVLIQR